MTSKTGPQEREQAASKARPLPVARPGKPGGKRDANRKAKIQTLSDAALALFLDRGIEATTIDEITKGAGVAKGSFYRYFDDKEALVDALFAPVARDVYAGLDACGEALKHAKGNAQMLAAYADLGGVLAGVYLRHSHALLLYLQENRGPAQGARRPICALATAVSERAVALTHAARGAGLLRTFPAKVSALAVVGAAERLLFAVLNGDSELDPLSLPLDLSSLILDGLRPPASP